MFKEPELLKAFFTKKDLSTFFEVITLQEDNIESSDLTFSSRIEKAVDEQSAYDAEVLSTRLQKASKLSYPDAHISDFSGDNSQGLSIEKLNNAISLNWIKASVNIGITGKAGTGKTRLGCAIANEAILHGYSVLFYRYSDLLRDLEFKEQEGYDKLNLFFRKLCRVKVLFIDDWGLARLNERQRYLLLDLIHKRSEKNTSLLITSQYQADVWYDLFKRDSVTDATIDRVYHCTDELALEGESFRRKNTMGDS